MLVYLIAVGGPMFGILYCLWRAWDYRQWWRPADATTIASDYSDEERAFDNTLAGHLTPHLGDTKGDRPTQCEIAFTDERGRRHRTTVRRYVYRGRRVMPTMTIWYDSRDPDRVDVFGCGGALFSAGLWGVFLGAALHALTRPGAPEMAALVTNTLLKR